MGGRYGPERCLQRGFQTSKRTHLEQIAKRLTEVEARRNPGRAFGASRADLQDVRHYPTTAGRERSNPGRPIVAKTTYIDSSALGEGRSVLQTKQHPQIHAPDVEHEKNRQRPHSPISQCCFEHMSSGGFAGMPRKFMQVSKRNPCEREYWNVHPNVCRVEQMELVSRKQVSNTARV